MLQPYICKTCGVQYSKSENPPENCIICEDERQYVSPKGHTWTTLDALQSSNEYTNKIENKEEGVYSITTKPAFAIGQTAYLVQGNNFNMLWDCITYIDDKTIKTINELGGIDAIALSHPHYYSSQVEWAETFDAPIYIHEDDKKWVTRPSEKIIYWSGDVLKLSDEFYLYRLGGHFKGGAVLNWTNGNNEKGILFSGDIIHSVAADGWVTFMYSYPNMIPLPAHTVQEMARKVEKIKFDRIYVAFNNSIKENAKEIVRKSAKRYVQAIEGELFDT